MGLLGSGHLNIASCCCRSLAENDAADSCEACEALLLDTFGPQVLSGDISACCCSVEERSLKVAVRLCNDLKIVTVWMGASKRCLSAVCLLA